MPKPSRRPMPAGGVAPPSSPYEREILRLNYAGDRAPETCTRPFQFPKLAGRCLPLSPWRDRPESNRVSLSHLQRCSRYTSIPGRSFSAEAPQGRRRMRPGGVEPPLAGYRPARLPLTYGRPRKAAGGTRTRIGFLGTEAPCSWATAAGSNRGCVREESNPLVPGTAGLRPATDPTRQRTRNERGIPPKQLPGREGGWTQGESHSHLRCAEPAFSC